MSKLETREKKKKRELSIVSCQTYFDTKRNSLNGSD